VRQGSFRASRLRYDAVLIANDLARCDVPDQDDCEKGRDGLRKW
jgi:hypothetical protein